jgi:hypothetical protein
MYNEVFHGTKIYSDNRRSYKFDKIKKTIVVQCNANNVINNK